MAISLGINGETPLRMSEAKIGELTTAYDNLCRAFGEPQAPGEGWKKTRVEWVIRSPFGLLIIGDWNQHDISVEELTHWFVHGQFRPAIEGEDKLTNTLGEVALVRDVVGAMNWLKERLNAC